ncbi:hypothetical protein IP88_10380 [alpha proteobacterium AAP81b]|nr:hypothetical protein IP88_10380 [alpha proteobacterium AAP81b]
MMHRHDLADLIPGFQDFGPIPPKTDPFGGTYLGGTTVMTRLWTTHLIKTSTEDMIVTPHLLSLGCNEPHVTRFLLSVTHPGEVFVDIGANIGYYSILGGWRVWPDGQVWSFEPQPDLYAMLSDNMMVNGFSAMARRHRVALSDRPGTAEMRIFEGYLAASTLRSPSADFIAHTEQETGRKSSTLTVPLVRLDDIMRDVPAIDVMKIDAEGYEPAIIRGAEAILARSTRARIIMEFVPPIMGRAEALDLLALLRRLGFSIYVLEADSSVISFDTDAELADRNFSELLLLGRGL